MPFFTLTSVLGISFVRAPKSPCVAANIITFVFLSWFGKYFFSNSINSSAFCNLNTSVMGAISS